MTTTTRHDNHDDDENYEKTTLRDFADDVYPPRILYLHTLLRSVRPDSGGVLAACRRAVTRDARYIPYDLRRTTANATLSPPSYSRRRDSSFPLVPIPFYSHLFPPSFPSSLDSFLSPFFSSVPQFASQKVKRCHFADAYSAL
ncbi:hypothetical protein ALC60_04326 [Trachymyrmex zeteki]|uniref:Uncharacterized protein n=1 Tax=Mycetomoellerius zeteki TaxID=64791 RepID=A0A151X8M4_9HYME|nr:hypothetical protein ALC60_04326 [Trachymyrmex zeteki]